MRKPTYKEKQDKERVEITASGLISARYSQIANMQFQMTYYRRGMNQVLMRRTLNFTPADHAFFHMKCMQDGCADGGYDLAPVVSAMVKCRKKSTSGKIFCRGTNDSFGHESIAYTVSIQYL